ncbi:glyoxylase-like metal-dependent hydrolase (beta-lactamase superfamily II) [Planomicrobium stackebrandtii]|uniref:Glyoxylase-like metal-dependent hydrolase (Beta-lactamase superfamily II) n=1 Tax=Planomicrobium stackebrandtii TaxID=253160 RepID=A0ABU0GQS8_9BACL|nr:MBL fold metallo-hydrolase [Planomicrobium stackebrandtii]MDQ0427329.1 glyoxylase-like metal-dependent hydrolase (beta-lactamase superfamily II) [Planomicrobium stackebrandtii]
MEDKQPIRLTERLHVIDGFDLGLPERTGTYVIAEEKLTLVDTGASPSVPHVKKGLAALGYALEDVKYIIVTHVHLDHSGGAGLLLLDCPNAIVVAHPKGARHLSDPSRLAAGARQVYGDQFDELFDPIVAIPDERLLIKAEGDQLQIGPDCTLEFWDTPGHANHHFSIYDPVSNGMFAGDTVGIRYDQLAREGIELYLPSTSPNQFNPEAMKQAMERMAAAQFDAIYFGHFGKTDQPERALHQSAEWLDVFVEEGKKAFAAELDPQQLADRLFERVQAHLRTKGIPDGHEVYPYIRLDMQVSSMGILDRLSKQK